MEMQSNPGGTVERSNVGAIQTYGIKDPAIVMQTLSGLYQNPRKIVVQEYISNGRDAHREVGKNDVPVHVTLPTDLDPQLRIRDFGPGLDSQRVTDVFCWFGESTKRGTNGQTGGFGIGAKCGFAYNSKSFTVTSVVDEDGERVKRLYAAYLNEQEIPEFVMMSEQPSDEPVGVEVAIPVAEHEFAYIKQHVKEVTQFWDMASNSVRPIIKNDEIEYTEFKKVMEGQGWILYDTEKDSYYGRRGEPFVILDGIKYPVPTDVYDGLDDEVHFITRLNVALLFNTGEIYPAANRETLKFNDQVKTLICDRLTECFNMVKQDMEAQIVNAETLYDANLKWQELDEHIGSKIVGSVKWKGYKVNGARLNAPDSSQVYYYHRTDYEYDGRLKTKKEGHLNWLSQDHVLVYNNETETVRPSPLRIKTIFKVLPDVDTIQVIHCTSHEGMIKWKEMGFDHLGCQNITKWEKMKRNRAKKGDRVVSNCFVHGDIVRYPRRTSWHNIEVDVKNDEGVFVTFHRGENLEGYRDEDLRWIAKKFDIEILGIPSRFISKAKQNPDMVPLKEWLAKTYKEFVDDAPTRSNLSRERAYLNVTNLNSYLEWGLDQFMCGGEIKATLPKDSCFNRLDRLRKIVKRYAKSRSESEDKQYYADVTILARITGHENPINDDIYKSKLQALFDECTATMKRLPLLWTISWSELYKRYSYSQPIISDSDRTAVMNHLIEYVKNNI